MHLALLLALAVAPAEPAKDAPPAKQGEAAAAEGKMGVAAQTMLGSTTLGGTSIGFVYDKGELSIEALLSFIATFGGNPTTWRLGAGVRVWYALHQGESADLSVGGGLAPTLFQNAVNTVQGGLYLEGGVRLRYFASKTFAVWTTLVLGLDFVFGSAFPGQPSVVATVDTLAGAYGGFGATYFF